VAWERCTDVLVENVVAELMSDSEPLAPLCAWMIHRWSPWEDDGITVVGTVPKTTIGLKFLTNYLYS
jgi:hypothetical protein